MIIFGGTTEGRLAIDVCEEAGKRFYYSTKSGLQNVEMHNGVRLTGAMTSKDIRKFCEENAVRCIIDAAHPFAENLHREIFLASKREGKDDIPVIRLQRSSAKKHEGVIYCDGYDDAIRKLKDADLECLLALSGANTISKLKSYWQNHKTIFRILNREESISIAERESLPKENIIFYNDDFKLPTKESEMNVFRSIGCDAIITKDSGKSGGIEEKVEAALSLGMKVFVVNAPRLQYDWTFVTGKYGLRKAIENIVSDFFPLKTGFTTGACATAATKAALLSLLNDDFPEEVSFALPDGEVMTVPVECNERGVASVIKDFSDDPDVTKGCKITSKVEILANHSHPSKKLNSDDSTLFLPPFGRDEVSFLQGSGVGKVTLPGLGIPVDEPAINPTPRKMMENEVRQLTDEDVAITISVENGEEIAKRTFNHKVGVIGGISIIGTSGIVHPLSNEAFVQSIRRELEVAHAIGCSEIGLVAGMKSEHALQEEKPDLRCIHHGNFIGEALKAAHELGFHSVTLAIMIGKAVKLAEGHLDTHSHKVQMNKEFLKKKAEEIIASSSLQILSSDSLCKETLLIQRIDDITMARELWDIMPPIFFEKIKELCLNHCRTVFPDGELTIKLICDKKQ